MSKKLDELREQHNKRMADVEARFAKFKENVAAAHAENIEAARAKLDEVKKGIDERRQEADEARAKIKTYAEEKAAEAQSRVEDWKTQRRIDKLERRVEDAEWHAGEATLVALQAIDDADVAVLEAVAARLDAEEAAATLRSPPRRRLWLDPQDLAASRGALEISRFVFAGKDRALVAADPLRLRLAERRLELEPARLLGTGPGKAVLAVEARSTWSPGGGRPTGRAPWYGSSRSPPPAASTPRCSTRSSAAACPPASWSSSCASAGPRRRSRRRAGCAGPNGSWAPCRASGRSVTGAGLLAG